MGNLDLGFPNWVGVIARDLEAQRSFYRDVLGLRELDAGDDWVSFDMGAGKLVELIALDHDRLQYDSVRYQTGFTVSDIRVAAAELARRGVEQITGIEGGPESGQYWCYFRDPEGNVFELIQPLK